MSLTLSALLEQNPRRVAGLMSGTSLDGVDVAVAYLTGSGPGMGIEMEAFTHSPYPHDLRQALLDNSAADTSSVREISQLNMLLAHVYADAVRDAMASAGHPLSSLDLVGSHGQTIHHVPEPELRSGRQITSTLQIGDPSALANLLQVPVVGDFRIADMALGGQGAPLVPYFDYVRFTSADETRGLLNLGGIANLTVLPRGAPVTRVTAFDTGPANMMVDALAQLLFGRPYDKGGSIASMGTISGELLDHLLQDEYYGRRPPKSTGRELFDVHYVERLVQQARVLALSDQEIISTVTELSARTIFDAYARFISPSHTLDVLIASGGGVHNRYLMQRLQDYFAPVPVRTIDEYGVGADAKEALCFAVLAHEFLNGAPANIPSVTGASRPTLLGKLCIPA